MAIKLSSVNCSFKLPGSHELKMRCAANFPSIITDGKSPSTRLGTWQFLAFSHLIHPIGTDNPNCEGYSAESSFNEYMSIGGGVVVVDVVVDWWSAHLIYLRVPPHPPTPLSQFTVFRFQFIRPIALPVETGREEVQRVGLARGLDI